MSQILGLQILRQSLRLAIWLYISGCAFFWLLWSKQDAAWFALGGGVALGNLFISAYVINFGMNKISQPALVIGLVLLKTLVFLSAVGALLLFFKPALLPFTLGVLLVIFSLIIWSVLRAGRFKRISGA